MSAQQVSNQSTVNVFKSVYGKLHELGPKDYPLQREIPFAEGAKVGNDFVETFVLSHEVGWTIAGTGQDAFDINPAISGVVKETTITPSQTMLSSVLPNAFISRSAGGGAKAFADGTKHVMSNHIKSHGKLQEILRIHGQSPALLGYVSYAASGTIYRGVAYTGSGTITLTKADGTTVVFTNGVNTTGTLGVYPILMAPGNYAAGIWVASENAVVYQVDSTGVIVGSGNLVTTDSDLGIIYVNFVPTVASSTTSHRLCFQGQEAVKDMVGMKKIMTNTGSLFGISAAQFSLWRGNTVDLGQKKFNLKAVQVGVSQAVNAGGLEEPLLILVAPRTFGGMITDEAALRKYDASYQGASAKNGFESITFYAANGTNTIMPHRMVMEGDVMGIVKTDWLRSGSAEISFQVPGIDKEMIFPLQNQAGWCVRSFSDQFIICRRPANQIFWKNCNPEGIDY